MNNLLKKVIAWLHGEKEESEKPHQVFMQKQPDPLKELQNLEEKKDISDDFTMAEAAGLVMKEEAES